MHKIWDKFRVILLRLLMILAYLPIRIVRLVFHLLFPVLFKTVPLEQYEIVNDVFDWLGMLVFYLLDLVGIPEIYEILNELINWNIRDLNAEEKVLAFEVFGSNLDLSHIRIHSRNLVARQLKIAYVSFRQINFYGLISNGIFVHEMVHVWQNQIFGSAYIYHALKAQCSKEGYDYGGIENLNVAYETGKKFHHFNFEQQGEIIQDFYRLKKTHPDQIDLLAFSAYRNQLEQLSKA